MAAKVGKAARMPILIIVLVLGGTSMATSVHDDQHEDKPGCCAVRLTVFDQLALPGERVCVTAKLEHAGLLGWDPDMHWYCLAFHFPNTEALRSCTRRDGLACVSIQASADAKALTCFQVRFSGSRHHQPAEARGRAFVWTADCPILVTDVDNTISDFDLLKVPFTPNDRIPPLPDAVNVLNDLGQVYRIVYLTARPVCLYNKTREWLTCHGFPEGPLFCRNYQLGETQAGFKRRFLTTLKNRFPNLAVGIGNRTGDRWAYRKAGLKVILIDPKLTHQKSDDVIVLDCWRRVGQLLLDGSPTPVEARPH
jgi:hypothetical protein